MKKKILKLAGIVLGLTSAISVPVLLSSCSSESSGSSSGQTPDTKPENIILNVQPSDPIYREGKNEGKGAQIINREKIVYIGDINTQEYKKFAPKYTKNYRNFFTIVKDYFEIFMDYSYQLYPDEYKSFFYEGEDWQNAPINNIDLAVELMKKHIMEQDVIWLFFDISDQDWLKIKNKVDLIFDFKREGKIVNGSLTIEEKPNSNLKLNGNTTSTFSFELAVNDLGIPITTAPLYVDFNAKTEQTVEKLIARLTVFLESNLFLSRSKAWDYTGNKYPQVSDYETINNSPYADDPVHVSYMQKNGYGLQDKPEWYYQHSDFPAVNEDFMITNLKVNEIVDLISFLTGLDLKKSFNNQLGLCGGFGRFSLGLQYGYDIRNDTFSLQELNRHGTKTDFKNVRLLSSNKKIGFGDIIRHLPKNDSYIRPVDELIDLINRYDIYNNELYQYDIGKMFKDGLFEQYRKPIK